MTKLTQTCLCLTLNKKNGNHWQDVRPSTSESSGLNLHFAFFKLVRTLEENILRGLKDWLEKCIFHPKNHHLNHFFSMKYEKFYCQLQFGLANISN